MIYDLQLLNFPAVTARPAHLCRGPLVRVVVGVVGILFVVLLAGVELLGRPLPLLLHIVQFGSFCVLGIFLPILYNLI